MIAAVIVFPDDAETGGLGDDGAGAVDAVEL